MKRIILPLLLAFGFSNYMNAQGDPQQDTCLIAKYYFNSGNINDDHIGGYHGSSAPGTTLVTDRFGNPNSAWYLNGTPNSYINLGTHAALKPTTLSVSMWIKIAAPVYSGSGYSYNPILLTKAKPGNNCWESYCFYYDMYTNKIAVAGTQLPCNQPCVWTPSIVSTGAWHHLVFTFDNSTLNLYLDAVLQGSVSKGFSQVYLASDSVMIGNSANIANNRFFNGTVDDMRFYDCVLDQTKVTSLYNEPNWASPTNVNTIKHETKATIFPSPTNGEFTISLNNLNENTSVEIYNALGQLIKREVLTGLQTKINLNEQANGVYFVKIISAEGSVLRKIIKE